MLNNSKYHLAEGEILSEQRAIEDAKSNPARFEVLYNRYYELILQFVYKRVEGKEAAYDITSQVFLNAMTNIKGYKFMGMPFSSWLYRIAVNEINQMFRSDKVRRAVKVDEDELKYVMDELKTAEETETRYRQITEALGELDEDELQIVELRFFEQRPFKEIGEILNITENNSKVKLYRVIDKMKKTLTLSKKSA
jgi:RNA polymerase sigma-70 factor (ECF subfamily)